MICMAIIISGPVSAATIHVNASSDYNTSSVSLNKQIQEILNSAKNGDTIEFLGRSYENISLIINKSLNIVTNVKTVITGSNSVNSIFIINGVKSSGTNITGFNLRAINGSGIIAHNTTKITLSKNNINMVNGTGFNIVYCSDINIENNIITNSKTGLSATSSKNLVITNNSIKKSSDNGINIKKSQKITIKKNQISSNSKDGISVDESNDITLESNSIENNRNNGLNVEKSNKIGVNENNINKNKGHGIYYGKQVINTKITNNNINYNNKVGIELDESGSNTYINSNNITGNLIGININNSSSNLVITQNLITDSVMHNDDETSGVGINFGSNYKYYPSFIVNYNAIYHNQRREIENRDTTENVIFGANWYGYSSSDGCNLCPKIQTQLITAQCTQSDIGIYDVVFYIGNDIANLLPSFEIGFRINNGIIRNILQQNGKATYKINYKDYQPADNVLMIKATFQKWFYNISNNDLKTLKTRSETPTDPGNNGNPGSGGSGNGKGSSTSGSGGGAGGSGGSSGAESNNGAESNPSSSDIGHVSIPSSKAISGLSSNNKGSNTGQDESNGKETSASKTVKELIINNTIKNPQIWSIVGIVILMIPVFGGYYRKDLIKMIKKSKK